MRKVVREEGILAGHSTGAHVYAALKEAEKLELDKTVVTIAADSVFRYLHLL